MPYSPINPEDIDTNLPGGHKRTCDAAPQLAQQQATNAEQPQQIEALTAGLQKISAAVELNKAAPTQVADTR